MTDDLLVVGGDLAPGTLLAAYRSGAFPMPVDLDDERVLGWWSPDPRGVLPLDRLTVSRSLRRSLRRYEITVDTDFAAVVAACAELERPHGWITPDIQSAYLTLHGLGWAHSVEAREPGGRLVGGLYGVAIGGLFAGESMFSLAVDASKVALVHLVERLRTGGGRLLDVQWPTPHLTSLGVRALPRSTYLDRLDEALAHPQLTLGN